MSDRLSISLAAIGFFNSLLEDETAFA